MLFTMADAVALRERVLAGLSEFDPAGNERVVPEKRRKYARALAEKSPPPSPAALFEAFKNADTSGGDPEQYLARLREITGKARVIQPAPAGPIDLTGLAKFARMDLGAILGDAGAPRPSDVTRYQHPAAAVLAASRVPSLFRRVLCSDGVRETAPLRDVRAWMAADDEVRKWAITLTLAKGTGKTLAACWALVAAGGGLYVKAEEIAAPDGRELTQTAEAASFLVLDDLADEVLTDLGTLRLRQLIMNRHANELRTAVTSNNGPAVFVSRYGTRVVDRLRDGVLKDYGGPSLRGIE